MSLTTKFAARSIKKQLQETFTNIALGTVTYIPETKGAAGVTSVAHYSAQFMAISKADGQTVQGGVSYARHFGGHGSHAFLVSSGPVQ